MTVNNTRPPSRQAQTILDNIKQHDQATYKKLQTSLAKHDKAGVAANIATGISNAAVSGWGAKATAQQRQDLAAKVAPDLLGSSEPGGGAAPNKPVKVSAKDSFGSGSIAADANGILDGSNKAIKAKQWGNLTTSLQAIKLQEQGPDKKGPTPRYNAAISQLEKNYGQGTANFVKNKVDHSGLSWNKDHLEQGGKPKTTDDVQKFFSNSKDWPKPGSFGLVSTQSTAAAAAVDHAKGGISTLRELPKGTQTKIIDDAKAVISGRVTNPSKEQIGAVALVLSQAKVFDKPTFDKINKSLGATYGQEVANTILSQVNRADVKLQTNNAGKLEFQDADGKPKTAQDAYDFYKGKAKYGEQDGDFGVKFSVFAKVDFNVQTKQLAPYA